MTKYFVIGSNCFTGSHIVDALLEDPQNEVIGVSRSPEYKDLFLPYKNKNLSHYSFHQIDMLKNFAKLSALLEQKKPEVVINVSALSEVALSNDRPIEYFDINTTAVAKLCHFLKGQKWLKKYVHISSAEIFGSCDKPVTETTLFNPSTPYAVSKAAGDMFIYTLMKNFQFPAIIIRSTNVYGAYQQLFKIIPRVMIYLKLGKQVELHGGGKAIKSFIHIKDVVNGLLMTLKKDKLGTFHFSVPSEKTVFDIVSDTCIIMNYDMKKAVKVVEERLGQDARYTLDCTKAKEELGWAPQITFKQGLQEIKDWIEKKWLDIKNEPLVYIHKS